MDTRFLSLVCLRLLGHSKNSPAEDPGEDTRNHPFSHSNTLGVTKLLNRQAGRELGEGGVPKEETFGTAFCDLLFFNPFDQIDKSMKMQYQAASDGNLA
jgi:hypothetical protein